MGTVSESKRQAATQLCAQYVTSILAFDDIVDVRKQKVNFQIFSCRIIGDSCVLVVANSAEECKNYIKYCVGGVDWVQADTREWEELITRGSYCWAGTMFSRAGKANIVLYKVNDKLVYTNGQTIKEYVKQALKNS